MSKLLDKLFKDINYYQDLVEEGLQNNNFYLRELVSLLKEKEEKEKENNYLRKEINRLNIEIKKLNDINLDILKSRDNKAVSVLDKLKRILN